MLALEGVEILDLSTVIDITDKVPSILGKVRSLSLLIVERTNAILQKLGYRRKEIENLRQEGVIF
jgi:crotonobetainyl-CoA:carnitine CoA-transferase CaiB-like acyl-CoA transferase